MAIPLNVGPMHFVLDGEDMPPTQGGSTLNFTFETLNSMADITGNFPRAQYYVGGSATITANFTELDMDDVLALFPSVDEATKSVRIPIGANAEDDAVDLILRPIIEGEVSNEDTLAIYAPKVIMKPNFNVSFSLSQQRIWTVDFVVLPYDPLAFDFTMLVFGAVSYTPPGT